MAEVPPPKFSELHIAAKIIKRAAIVLAAVYLIARILRWYRSFFGGYQDVESVTTLSGNLNYLIETAFILAGLGMLYVFGDCLRALWHIATRE